MRFLISAISSFRSIERQYDLYRDRDCMKKFCEFSRDYTMKIINFKKKNMKLLRKDSRNHVKMLKFVVFVGKSFKIKI